MTLLAIGAVIVLIGFLEMLAARAGARRGERIARDILSKYGEKR